MPVFAYLAFTLCFLQLQPPCFKDQVFHSRSASLALPSAKGPQSIDPKGSDHMAMMPQGSEHGKTMEVFDGVKHDAEGHGLESNKVHSTEGPLT